METPKSPAQVMRDLMNSLEKEMADGQTHGLLFQPETLQRSNLMEKGMVGRTMRKKAGEIQSKLPGTRAEVGAETKKEIEEYSKALYKTWIKWLNQIDQIDIESRKRKEVLKKKEDGNREFFIRFLANGLQMSESNIKQFLTHAKLLDKYDDKINDLKEKGIIFESFSLSEASVKSMLDDLSQFVYDNPKVEINGRSIGDVPRSKSSDKKSSKGNDFITAYREIIEKGTEVYQYLPDDIEKTNLGRRWPTFNGDNELSEDEACKIVGWALFIKPYTRTNKELLKNIEKLVTKIKPIDIDDIKSKIKLTSRDYKKLIGSSNNKHDKVYIALCYGAYNIFDLRRWR